MAKTKKIGVDGIVGYCRVSTEEQAQSGLGLAAQRNAIKAEAHRRGLELLTIHEDQGLSGKSLNRPGLSAALSDLGHGQGSILVVAKLDRLSRSVHDATGLMQRADHEGWGLVALDAHVDTTTPQGAAMTQVMAVFAELERRLIGERTKSALTEKKRQGITLGRPRLVPDQVVQRINRERATGATWKTIADRLTQENVPTAQGGARWYPATVRLIATRTN